MKQKQIPQFEKISNHIETIHYGPYSIVNIKKTAKEEIQFLSEEFQIERSDLNDTLPTFQRPKITVRENYLFVILIFPIENTKTNSITSAKLEMFIFPEMVLFVHTNTIPPMQILKQELDNLAAEFSPHHFSPENIVPWLTTQLYAYCMPISDRLALSIDQIEEKIFSEDLGNRKIVKDLFTIEREVVDFRKIMRSHSMVIDKLANVLPEFSHGRTILAGIQDMMEYPRIVWTNLESHTEAIDTLRQTYESLSSFYLNDILKNLTIFTVIIAPMTMVASIFGMNFKLIPFANHPQGFVLTVVFVVILSSFAFAYFKVKKWI